MKRHHGSVFKNEFKKSMWGIGTSVAEISEPWEGMARAVFE
jgi:hypothetical protein